jgi:methylenetetrahydrofolate dehydrogenase (NADP+)/methenyltetrahydrofolate cyclohydrolase
MEINGKILQLELLKGLGERIENLKRRGVTPKIAIVTLGPEETWEAYVGQKIKLADSLGIEKKLINLRPKETSEVLSVIEELNQDPTIHGLIVQRPFPTYIDTERIIQSVSKEKDIDGFRKDSLYEVPVFLAVFHLIKYIATLLEVPDVRLWLSNQHILVIGKGETAGFPVINGLSKMKIESTVMDTKTSNCDKLFSTADIIIFATGRRVEVPFKLLKKNSILIGIGLHRDGTKLEGDFDQNEAIGHVLYYTPSPGGVGPLNLYFLFDNLIKSCEQFA